jgi:uncharacterized protein YdaU (DUF1376 family)
MNYYEKHVGDYLKDTVSLSMLEDGAYNRLLDQYYQTEHPLPAAKSEIYRMARATSAAERKAVDYVVGRYFELTPEGYRQKRCDELIEAFWEKDSKKEAGKENDRERQQRARERRKTLFEELRVLGIVPEYNAKTKELEAMLSRATSQGKSQDDHEPVTRDNTATQSPITSNQEIQDQEPSVLVTGGQESNVTPIRPADCPHQAIVDLYHEILPALPGVKILTEARQKTLRTRWRENPKHQTLDFWRRFFAYVAESDFLMGRIPRGSGHEHWTASFDFLITQAKFVNIIEGKYHHESA